MINVNIDDKNIARRKINGKDRLMMDEMNNQSGNMDKISIDRESEVMNIKTVNKNILIVNIFASFSFLKKGRIA